MFVCMVTAIQLMSMVFFQDTVEMWSLFACSDNLTDCLAPSAGDETQTDGLERLKRVAMTRAPEGALGKF